MRLLECPEAECVDIRRRRRARTEVGKRYVDEATGR